MSKISNQELKKLLTHAINAGGDSLNTVKEIFKTNDIDDYNFGSTKHISESVDELIKEIRLNGGNTLINIIRGWVGVDYSEIVDDVADKLDIDRDSVKHCGRVEDVEKLIISSVISKYFSEMPEEERRLTLKNIQDAIGRDGQDLAKLLIEGASASIISALLSQLSAQVIREVLSALIARIVARQVAAGVAARVADMAVPFVNIVMGVWLALDIAGPAYRKTIPTVILIAMLRLTAEDDKKGDF